MKTHFNTTNESGQTLLSFNQKAMTQQEIIFSTFKRQHAHILTPSMIWKLTGQRWPITSIRRAITNLTEDGKLIKTEQKHKGLYDRPEYAWKLAAL
jgi:hypothetical protein